VNKAYPAFELYHQTKEIINKRRRGCYLAGELALLKGVDQGDRCPKALSDQHWKSGVASAAFAFMSALKNERALKMRGPRPTNK
jgi:hypothetical protein